MHKEIAHLVIYERATVEPVDNRIAIYARHMDNALNRGGRSAWNASCTTLRRSQWTASANRPLHYVDWGKTVTSIDLVAVCRLSRLLLVTTQDARRELDGDAGHDQLHRHVEVAAAVAQELARVLGLKDANALRERRALTIAQAVISKAQSAQ